MTESEQLEDLDLPRRGPHRWLFANHPPAEIRVCRYGGAPECDVIVSFRGREMLIRCRDFAQARIWAQVECKAYGVTDFAVERY